MKRAEPDVPTDVTFLEVVGHSVSSEGKRYKVKCQVQGSGRTRELQLKPTDVPSELLKTYEEKNRGAQMSQLLAAKPAPPGLRDRDTGVALREPSASTRGAMSAGPIIFSMGFLARRDAFVVATRNAVMADVDSGRAENAAAKRSAIVQVECTSVSSAGALKLKPVLEHDAFDHTMPVGQRMVLCGCTSAQDSEEEWQVRVAEVSRRRIRVTPIDKPPRKAKGAIFTLYAPQRSDDRPNVTARVQLAALNTILTRADCMSIPLMEMLMAGDQDSRVGAEHFASMRPALSALKLPAAPEAAMQRLGYQLNDSQLRAVSTAMQRSLTLVQGPPGTGKSYFAARMIAIVAKANAVADGSAVSPLLVVCESNSAVDNLLELLDGLHVPGLVRVVSSGGGAEGSDRPMSAIAARYSLDAKLPQARGRERQKQMRAALRKASVVLSTNTSAAQLQCYPLFEFCVMDEGSASGIPSALVPMTLGVRCLIVLGDHKQLSPFTNIRDRDMLSFFEWCIQRGVHNCLLDVQYRMHPSISAWPNRTFYSGNVRDDESVLRAPAPRDFPWVNGERVLFFDVQRGREESYKNSWCNDEEARVVAKIVGRLIDREPATVSIGVISYYSQQVHELRLRCSNARVTVDTVDSFQGHERDVIVISTVRSAGTVGFLRNPRRWNVSVTRARRALIVVGHAQTLRTDPCIRDWMEYLAERRLIVDAERVTKSWPFMKL